MWFDPRPNAEFPESFQIKDRSFGRSDPLASGSDLYPNRECDSAAGRNRNSLIQPCLVRTHAREDLVRDVASVHAKVAIRPSLANERYHLRFTQDAPAPILLKTWVIRPWHPPVGNQARHTGALGLSLVGAVLKARVGHSVARAIGQRRQGAEEAHSEQEAESSDYSQGWAHFHLPGRQNADTIR